MHADTQVCGTTLDLQTKVWKSAIKVKGVVRLRAQAKLTPRKDSGSSKTTLNPFTTRTLCSLAIKVMPLTHEV